MNYIKVDLNLKPVEPLRDILISEFAELDFESFENTESGFEGYIQKDRFDKNELKSLLESYAALGDIVHEVSEIEDQNWNAVWESEYEIVDVEGKCLVRAPFHQIEKPYDYDIIIQPKMSFGTGHHETTFMMVSHSLETELVDKDVLDMGSGTGVLAILAAKMGARTVDAIDIEDWAFENTIENKTLNDVEINVEKGDASILKGRSYDVILANINKNVLLQDLPTYVQCLKSDGVLILSGFFETDVTDLERAANELHLKLQGTKSRNGWAALKFKK